MDDIIKTLQLRYRNKAARARAIKNVGKWDTTRLFPLGDVKYVQVTIEKWEFLNWRMDNIVECLIYDEPVKESCDVMRAMERDEAEWLLSAN